MIQDNRVQPSERNNCPTCGPRGRGEKGATAHDYGYHKADAKRRGSKDVEDLNGDTYCTDCARAHESDEPEEVAAGAALHAKENADESPKSKSTRGAWDDAMAAPVSWESLRKEGPHKMIEEPEDAMTDNPPEAPKDRGNHESRRVDPRN